MAMLALATNPTLAREPMTEAQSPQDIIKESVAAYPVTASMRVSVKMWPATAQAGGSRSAYSRPGGAAPLCYQKDVSDGWSPIGDECTAKRVYASVRLTTSVRK